MVQGLVWVLLSAILWLGNVEFDSAGDDSVTVRRDEALTNAAQLLSVPEDELVTALSQRSLSAGVAQSTSVGVAMHAHTRPAGGGGLFYALHAMCACILPPLPAHHRLASMHECRCLVLTWYMS
jgi:hypothetical protein